MICYECIHYTNMYLFHYLSRLIVFANQNVERNNVSASSDNIISDVFLPCSFANQSNSVFIFFSPKHGFFPQDAAP